MKLSLHLLIAAAAAAALAACDPAVGPATATLMPKTGTTMTIETYDLTQWGLVVPGSSDLRYVTIQSDTPTYKGRTNVSRYILRRSPNVLGPADTAWAHVAENGDLATLQKGGTIGPLRISDRWEVFPFGSRGSRPFTWLDTTITLGTNVYTYREDFTPSFLGPETLDTGLVLPATRRGDLSVLKSQLVRVVTTSLNMGLRYPVTTAITNWYSPKLGALVRQETMVTWIEDGQLKGSGGGWRIVTYRQP